MTVKQASESFEFQEGSDTLSPKLMLELPRPGAGVPNCDGDLALITVSNHSFDKDKTDKRLYIVSLKAAQGSKPTSASDLLQAIPSDADIEAGGEAFWLDSRTIGYIAEGKQESKEVTSQSTLYAIPISSASTIGKPVSIGKFPPAVNPANVQYSTKAFILVFTAHVYADEDLHTVQKQDATYENRGNSAKVYDVTYARHWDEWIGPKKSSLFTISVKKGTDGKWEMGDRYGAPLKGTEHHVPVEPFGGVEDYSISEKHILYNTIDPEHSEAWHTRHNVYLVDLTTDTKSAAPRQLSSGKHGQTHSPVLSPSGKWAAWLQRAEDGYEADRARVVLAHVESGNHKVLDALDKWDRSPNGIIWDREESSLWMSVDDHGYVKLFKLELPGDGDLQAIVGSKQSDWVPKPVPYTKTGAVSNLVALPGNRVLYSLSSLTGPNELHLLSANGKSEQLTDFTKSHLGSNTKLKLDAGESFWFEGDKGIQVQGFILKPKGYETSQNSDKKWPAVLLIHGGPQSAWADQWSTRWNQNVFAQQGYFVVALNPTGSTGFGQDFTDGITKDWGGAPFVDLQKGWKEALRKYPEIDQERTAAAGASWGGFAINWIQGHPEYDFKFKAVIAHAGVFDARNMGFITEEVFFYNHDFGGVPWEGAGEELGQKYNPANLVSKWAIPQLCIHGSKDYRLSEVESLGAFNSLQQKHIPSRLVIFPDENHWVLKPGNSLQWHFEVFRWLHQFIGQGAR